ncbi:MAG TPA: S8/S53 family peptidase [Pseudonocardiaceae bacterium]|jgi:hypothetical protein|nr:S8/S53 family peptidase [Pseudonocardiaceae bacterium]
MTEQPPQEPGPERRDTSRDIDPPPLPPEVLARHNARVLNPVTAARLPGSPPPRSTVYVADRLLVPAEAMDSPAFEMLREHASSAGLAVVPDEQALRFGGFLAAADTGTPYAVPVRLVPAGEGPVTPPNAWEVLLALRTAARGTDAELMVRRFGLDHLATGSTSPLIGGTPVGIPHSIGGAPVGIPHGIASYVFPGSGGRTPVAYIGPDPARRADFPTRRPVVAVLDSGCGTHPWLDPAIVARGAEANGWPAGLTDPATDPEVSGDLVGPLDGQLDEFAGHGTFICGLVRQRCPDADLLAIRVMSADGIVVESVLAQALAVLHVRQVLAQRRGTPDQMLDVISLSFGYYHEAPTDAAEDLVLLDLLTKLGAAGVTVVAAAGNQSGTRPMYPAALAPYPGGYVEVPVPDVLPVISVGARNPDGRTVALFSNSGEWVLAWEVGAAVVSTFPTTFDGGSTATDRTGDPKGGDRCTIDPDDFSGGFGTWSGTSFAAPLLAGRLAQALIDGPIPLDDADAVGRGWAAVTALTGIAP